MGEPDVFMYGRLNKHAKKLAKIIVEEHNLNVPECFMRRLFVVTPHALWTIILPGYTKAVQEEIIRLIKKSE